jgi:phospholipid/cholesterol/gamma-HCH transport system substrate-binding protein
MATALKVGIFGTICLIVLALLIWNIEDLNPFGTKGQKLAAVFDSVAGLDDKAAVRVAGVRVGRVDGVGLDGRRARVGLVLDQPLGLTQGTTARIANLGLLGDKYIEIIPGPAGAPPLPPGAVIPGSTPPSFDDAMAKLEEIGTSIQQVTGSLSGSLGGGGIERLLTSLEATSDEIRGLVAENRQHVASTVRNFDAASATLARELPVLAGEMQRAVTQISMLVEANRGNVDASMANVRTLTEKLQTSVDNLNQISGKIASGEGTIGKLVNSEEGYNEVIATLDSIQGGVETLSGTIGAIRKFKLDLDVHGYVLADGGEGDRTGGDDSESLSSFGVTIDPQDGRRLYRAGFSNTPGGDVKTKTQVITTMLPDGTTERETIETVTTEDRRVLTGLFGYRTPKDLRLWAGLIESTGGGQVEYPLLDRRLWLSLEAFDFNRQDDLAPHLRFSTRWQVHPNVYLLGGYDDFLGGGIQWNDDNLKYLLGSLPLN